ncbi:MAG TPA: hypothetical protein VHL77_12570, partial [Ferruginibacter sp.]|nr:hypothetical protein [Ferruginibacter sp.]
MKRLLFFALFFATTVSYFSCQKTDPAAINPAAQPASNGQQTSTPSQTQKYVIIPESGDEGPIRGRIDDCIPGEVALIAGQTMNAGSVTVTNDASYIYVTYTTTNGWVLTETHLYVGDCALIPVNNPGNPIPGQFPYSGTHANLTTYTYQIPISAIPAGSCGCIAAHAVVKQ